MATVEIRELTKSFEHKPVLEGVSVTVGEGELVTLLGPSGCGKTTTLRCVAGLERPDGGEIKIGDRLVASGGGVFEPPNRRGVGMVFQSYALWPHMTVFANVAYPLRVRRGSRSELRDKAVLSRVVMEALEAVGMAGLATRHVTALSGGQQQRVALVRAMVAHPAVLLFDEPLSNLDVWLRSAMRKEIHRVHELAGASSIYVTHDQEEAITLSDRVVVLHRGRVQQEGDPRTIYRRPANRFVADFLGFENLVPGVVAETRGEEVGVRLLADGDPVWAVAGAAPGSGAVSPSSARLAAGSGVLCAVRAEDLSLLDAARAVGPPVAGSLPCTVVSSVFVGDRIERVVEAGPHRLVVRSLDRDDRAEDGLVPGAPALVRFPPGRTVAVPDDEPGARHAWPGSGLPAWPGGRRVTPPVGRGEPGDPEGSGGAAPGHRVGGAGGAGGAAGSISRSVPVPTGTP